MNSTIDFRKIIENVVSTHPIKVISFDIFDTLVYRPFVKPTDLFKYIEITYKAKGFFRARKRAEIKARLILKKEVGFDDIYNCISSKFIRFKEIEKQLEFEMLRCNEKVFEVYKNLKNSGYKVIATSDMYFDKTFLANVLQKCGYYVDEVFVSTEYNATKRSGKLYDIVINCLKNNGIITKANEILHIGDNHQSDYNKAKSRELLAINITTCYEDLFQDCKFLNRFYRLSHKSLASSLIVGNIAHNHNNDFLYNLGYNIVSFLSLVYASFILEESKKKHIEQLLFIARDGYFIKKVMEILLEKDMHIELSYVYAPRKQFMLTHYVDDSGIFRNFFISNNFCKLVLDYFNIDTDSVKPSKYYNVHSDLIKQKMQDLRKIYNYAEYIKAIVNKKNIAIVDGMSGSLRAQKLISKELGVKSFGFYLISFSGKIGSNKNYQIDRLVKHLWQNVYFTRDISNMIERLFQSPEETAYFVNCDGVVTFKESQSLDKRSEIYHTIEQGVSDSIRNLMLLMNDSILELFNDSNLFLKLLATFRIFDKYNFKKVEKQLYVEFLGEKKKEILANDKSTT